MHAGLGDAGLNVRRLWYAQVSGTRIALLPMSPLPTAYDPYCFAAYCFTAVLLPCLCMCMACTVHNNLRSPENKAAILNQANVAAQKDGHLTSEKELGFITLEELTPSGERYTKEELNELAKRLVGTNRAYSFTTTAGIHARAAVHAHGHAVCGHTYVGKHTQAPVSYRLRFRRLREG